MPDLLLDKQRVVTGLDQVRHVRMPQRVQGKLLREPGDFPHPLERAVKIAENSGAGAFRRPQAGRPVRSGETFPAGRGEPVLKEPDDPIEFRDSQNRASAGAEPLVPLAHRTWSAPNRPNDSTCGLGPKSTYSSIASSRRRSPYA